MEADLLSSTEFYILDTDFNKIHALTQYESLMWVDKYDEPGTIEIYAPPIDEIIKAAQIDNYIMSTKSNHVMIIEKLVTTFSSTDGARLVISGRSLESILDRRVVFTTTYFHQKDDGTDSGADNLEDAIRQLLDYTIIQPDNTDREISNFIFEYTYDSAINTINLDDCSFDKGSNVLTIVESLVKSKNVGFMVTLNSSNQFVFKLIKGKDRTSEQNVNPLVQFSPIFNNLKESKYTEDAGENYKNYIYTEGETYNSTAPYIIETGDETGLARREYYTTSDTTHEQESTNLHYNSSTGEWYFSKDSTTLTDAEYIQTLEKEGASSYQSFSIQTTMESEIESRLQFVYGTDFFIGDIVEIKDMAGNTSRSWVKEFIISHSTSGYEEYPTFEDYDEASATPDQSYSSGGDYTENTGLYVDKAEYTIAIAPMSSVSTINIPTILGYKNGDILLIDISGLTLGLGFDYTLNGTTSITLTTPLTHDAYVHFVRFRVIK